MIVSSGTEATASDILRVLKFTSKVLWQNSKRPQESRANGCWIVLLCRSYDKNSKFVFGRRYIELIYLHDFFLQKLNYIQITGEAEMLHDRKLFI